MHDVREASINLVGGFRMPLLGELNERAMSVEQVRDAVNEINAGKVTGLDGFPGECLKKGGMAMLKCLVRLLNESSNLGLIF